MDCSLHPGSAEVSDRAWHARQATDAEQQALRRAWAAGEDVLGVVCACVDVTALKALLARSGIYTWIQCTDLDSTVCRDRPRA